MSPSAAAYLYAAIVAAGLGYIVAQIPVQVSDSLLNIITASTSTWGELLAGIGAKAYLRPFINPQTKLVLDLAPGHEFAAFRALHVLQIAIAFGLFVRALRVATWAATAAALIAISVFAGSHTFIPLVNEAYPINTYLTVALCALVALNVVTEPRSRWWSDVLVVAVFALALGTIENGLLIWVAAVAAAIVGYRGVSRPALAAMTVLVAAYFAVRFLVLDVGTPELSERSTGFLLARLEPDQLIARFGDNPLPLYAYNVISQVSTVLLGEPRDGVITVARAIVEDDLRPWMVINVLSAVAVTLLLVWYASTVTWRRSVTSWAEGQRLLVIAVVVLAANAVISYPYVKNQIMSVAGMFIAASVAPAIAARLESPPRTLWARSAACALVLIAAMTWSWRVLGVQHSLTHAAVAHRNDWAIVDPAKAVAGRSGDGAVVALIASLRTRAITAPATYPHVRSSRFVERWFEH